MHDAQTDASYDDLFNDSVFHASRVQGARAVTAMHPKPITVMRSYVDFGEQTGVDRSTSISDMTSRRSAGEALAGLAGLAGRQPFHGGHGGHGHARGGHGFGGHGFGHGHGRMFAHGYGGMWRVPGAYAGAYGQWVYDHSIGAWRWVSLYSL